MAKEEKAADAAPKKKSKKKLIIIVAAVVVLLGGGAGGYFAFFSGPSAPPAPKPGKVVALDAITLNLADGHFLKLKLSLQATMDATEEPDGSKALDIAISEFSNRPLAELASNAARDKVKAELRKKINEAYEGHVMDIYFTEFVMQ
ncbi:flagellar basal body-associated FliL family protein [Planosporangium sp. 12N6]|uniref:flagellar basal body-associated FliL family protein n=1 Tax=Planosporangium spinosum TaxID=3402278 RepID=UPI003CF42F84